VRLAVGHIASGPLEKVVLARDLVATAAEPVDVRWPLQRLAASYPSCWTYCVTVCSAPHPSCWCVESGGWSPHGSSPARSGEPATTSTTWRSPVRLARSSKDLEEHEYAVRSVASALAAHCSSMNVPETPFVLHLPNVMHLATDVAGVSSDEASALQLAAALHPSARLGVPPPTSRSRC
jgi:menaquinone-specific isochorismate synthase